MRKANIHQVAARAGVSTKTVSRVVNDEPFVRDSTRERVLRAVKALNYRPNPSARRLAGQRSFLIGLLYDNPDKFDNPDSSYIVNIQQGVLRACEQHGYDLVIHPCDYRDSTLLASIEALLDHSRLDGLILSPPLSDLDELIAALVDGGQQRRAVPVARISPGSKRSFADAVFTDDRGTCAEMTLHLAKLGHERIAFIQGHPDHKALVKRYQGYRDGLRAAGLPFHADLVKLGDNSFQSGEACARRLLLGDSPPGAIFACNDEMAAGVIAVAHRLGLHLPDELSVAGFDDAAHAKAIYPALTTVRQPVQAMAECVTGMLIDRMHGRPPVNARQEIPSTLIVRESTGPAPRRTDASPVAVRRASTATDR